MAESRLITIKDVEDLFDMEGNSFDILIAIANRANEIDEAAAAAVINQPPPRRSERSAAARRNYSAGESSSAAARRRIVAAGGGRENAPPLPAAFRDAIAAMAPAAEPALVIQKRLYATDVSGNHNRLSIPMGQIDDGFLTAAEKRRLGGGHLEVRVVEPSAAAVAAAKLSRWGIGRSEGKKLYAINGNWNEIVERNGLECDMVVQLWSFRVDGDLCFALVRLPPPPEMPPEAD